MAREIPEQVFEWFERILDKLEQHPTYGPAMKTSRTRDERWVLNYHSHGEGQPFCISICTREEKLAIFGLPAPLEELAHIRGVGQHADDCVPLATIFGKLLLERYPGAKEPLVFFQGEPLPA